MVTYIIAFIVIVAIIIIVSMEKKKKKSKPVRIKKEEPKVPQGLQTFDSEGVIQVDITSRLQKILGFVDIDGSATSGSITNEQLANGELWYFFLTISYPELRVTSTPSSLPTITKSGNTLYWKFPRESVKCRLMYGVY